MHYNGYWKFPLAKNLKKKHPSIDISIIVLFFVILAVAYSLATPIFETPDEMAHFAYMRRLLDGHGFPAAPIVIADDAPAQESSQPPIYYLAAALGVRLFAPDTSDLARWTVRNPAFPYIFGAVPNDNKNLVMHTVPAAFPYQGAVRAAHVARLVAILFGAVTVWATYRLALELFPEWRSLALLAASFVAFLPQFVFISGAVSNDSAAAAFCALSLWAGVRIMQRGFTARRAIGLGLVLGLAALSKASALVIWPIVFAWVFLISRNASSWVARLRWIIVPLVIAAGLTAPWYLHLWHEFGDVLGTSPHMLMSWARPVPLSFWEAASKLPYALISFWLAFGWGNIIAPDWVYTLFNLLLAAGLIGLPIYLARLWRQRFSNPAAPIELAGLIGLMLSVILVVIALVRWIQLLDAAIGRLIFPALGAIAVLLSVGWLTIWPRRLPQRSIALIPLALLGLTVLAIPTILLRAYAPPQILTPNELAQQPGQPLNVRFGEVARLIRLDVPRDHWPKPGEGTVLNLCWQPLQQDARLLMALVQIVGENNRVWFSRRTVPGLGSYSTSVWQPDGLFCDPVYVHIDEQTPPGVYRLEVALIDQGTQERLPAYAPDGASLTTNFVGWIKVAPDHYAEPPIEKRLDQRFGNQIALIGYDLDRATVKPGDQVRLRLYWRALQQPAADYTVFAQVRAADNQIVAQKDSPPQSGAYPTSFWDAGEVVIDDRVIEIPAKTTPGTYPIKIGLYVPADGSRLKLDGSSADEVTLPVELEVQ